MCYLGNEMLFGLQNSVYILVSLNWFFDSVISMGKVLVKILKGPHIIDLITLPQFLQCDNASSTVKV